MGRTPPIFLSALTSVFAKVFDRLYCSSGLFLYALSTPFRRSIREEEGLLHASVKQY